MIIIIDYEAGNLTSVKKALDHLNIPCKITSDSDEIENAEKVIFPGVGNAKSAMRTLKKKMLDKSILNAFSSGIPILGICLGSQIILTHSEEGDTDCLDIIKGNCPQFNLSDKSLKIPHMGWNALKIKKPHPILEGIKDNDEFYFVHSYYPLPEDKNMIYATCEYGIKFPAIIGNNNIIATQFHLEKSGRLGLKILSNFCSWDGKLNVK